MRKMNRLSIKVKVTLWFTIVMLIMVIITFIILVLVSDVEVSKNYKKQLQEVVEYDMRQVEYDEGELEFEDDFISYKAGIFIFVFDEKGNLLLGENQKLVVDDKPSQDGNVYEVTRNNEKYFAYDRQVTIEDYGKIWIRGMMEEGVGNQKNIVGIVLQVAFIGFPILAILAVGAGYILTKQSFKPVESIIHSAETINEGKDLSKRIGLVEGDDEIYRLAQSFDKMFERLESAFEAEKKFTSDASHELRTPTTVILSQCEYVLDGERTVDEYKEAIEVIERQGYKMSKLISQLLAFTRLEQGIHAINREHINFSELVASICEEQAYLQIKGITIKQEIESNVFVDVDVMLMSRVLNNLISNAYKYGKENGHIIVTLKKEKEEIYLSVEDNGIGIKEEDLAKIWHRFYRVDESRHSTHDHSMGLGLAMVKQIVSLHGAHIKVESKWQEGSRFILTIKKN